MQIQNIPFRTDLNVLIYAEFIRRISDIRKLKISLDFGKETFSWSLKTVKFGLSSKKEPAKKGS